MILVISLAIGIVALLAGIILVLGALKDLTMTVIMGLAGAFLLAAGCLLLLNAFDVQLSIPILSSWSFNF